MVESRASIISSVKTPLGLFALITLVVDTVLVAGGAPPWIPGTLLGLVILAVVAIALKRPDLLRPEGSFSSVTISLVFPRQIKPVEIYFDDERCRLIVRDKEGKRKQECEPRLRFGPGGWVLDLDNVIASDSVRLELIDSNGRRWRVNPFTPFESQRDVLPVQDGGTGG